MLNKLQTLLIQAEKSELKRSILNFGLMRAIPFNKPHGIKIESVSPLCVKASIPYKKSNYNHIKGIHACGLATVSEFCSGLLLMRHVSGSDYRLIMQTLSTNFLYQAKRNIVAECQLSEEDLENKIISPASSFETFSIELEVKCFDSDRNHCATTTVLWQLKPWKDVRTAS